MKKCLLATFIIASLSSIGFASGCKAVYESSGNSAVCECTASYCDTVTPLGKLSQNEVALYQTSKSGDRLQREPNLSIISKPNDGWQNISIDLQQKHQKILGFGGAFTDSFGINVLSLKPSLQQELMSSYFGRSGIQYDIARVPMASTDYSTKVYSYDDAPSSNYHDFALKNFALSAFDKQDKIPLINRAKQLSSRTIHFFASPWSAPSWMKVDEKSPMVGGELNPKVGTRKVNGIEQTYKPYYQTWALYFEKFLASYKKAGINFWGVTAQNEMNDNLQWFQTMAYTPQSEADFIGNYLGPELKKTFPKTKIMMLDDGLKYVNTQASQILSYPKAKQYISGTGIHWYFAPKNSTSILDNLHKLSPNKFILGTEASTGFMLPFNGPELGNYNRAEAYASDIIRDLNHSVIGWTDWNMALNMKGGPDWAKSYTDAPIIVDASKQVFYKQPMYYYLGQFSKFITPGSYEVQSTSSGPMPLKSTAVVTPQGNLVVEILNTSNLEKTFHIQISANEFVNNSIPSHSLQTYVIKLSTSQVS
ncbi:hypothetical protein OAO18_05935 [Francisellaceae bacterium]|nr:hypothetical protein [Francisellaceae bacterium]